MIELEFFVKGEPRPKQSFRVGKNGGYQPARVKAWQMDVAIAAQEAMRKASRFNEPYDRTPLNVSLLFFLGNHRRVDLDNLSKAVLDGMNGIVFSDDQQVVELSLRKCVIDHPGDRAGVHVAIANSEMTL